MFFFVVVVLFSIAVPSPVLVVTRPLVLIIIFFHLSRTHNAVPCIPLDCVARARVRDIFLFHVLLRTLG